MRHQSRIQFLIDENYRLLDTRAKSLMDALRIVSANLFASLIDRLRPLLNNYRNDHVLLRQLSRASGFIHRQADTVHIQLWLKGDYEPRVRNKLQQFLGGLSLHLTNTFTHHGTPRIRITLTTHRPNP